MSDLGAGAATKNYLSRIGEKQDERRWMRRECNIMVRVMFPSKGVRKVTILNARILDISEGGALAIIPYENVPKHFYIAIGKFQHNIGCVAKLIKKENVHIEFIKVQNGNLINYLSRFDNKFETLQELKYDFTLFEKIK
jgi:hypothetical protein